MWEQIRSNQIKSVVLVVVMGVLFLALGYSLGVVFFDSSTAGLVLAIILWAIMNLIAFSQGDSILLSVSGARKISQDDHPRLYNIVEEMKIASGLENMPDIYIIDDSALNAFATGRDQNHTAVAVTSGLLQKLNRDELQGVIGHEMAHIKNRDVQLMALLVVLMGTIVILGWFASRYILYGGDMPKSRRESSSGAAGGIQLIIIVIGLILIILAPIFAQLIYYAVSRKREYLADASSALYTRYPEGLASALEKLASSDTEVRGANKATAPMYTINPFQKKGMSVNDPTSTHPPIAERVRILRSMAGASPADYERAYQQLKRKGVIPTSALAGASAVALREASSPEAAPGVQTTMKLERTRETSDLMWRLSNYKTITCSECGVRMRLPPNFNRRFIRCPHCGYINPI